MINISKGLRNILVGAAFVLTIILIYADSLNPKVSKEIPKTVRVFNNTEYDVEFKTKLIINKILGHDSIFIKFDYMIEPVYINEIRVSAHVVKNPMFENQYMVYITKNLKPYHEDIVLSHELQHIHQFEISDLEILDVFMGSYRYKEDTLMFGLLPYKDRPEEIDAYAKEDSIYNQLQILLKDYESETNTN